MLILITVAANYLITAHPSTFLDLPGFTYTVTPSSATVVGESTWVDVTLTATNTWGLSMCPSDVATYGEYKEYPDGRPWKTSPAQWRARVRGKVGTHNIEFILYDNVHINPNGDYSKSCYFYLTVLPVPTFTLTTYVLPDDVAGIVTPRSGTYDNGTVVSITATPGAGYSFDHWSGDASGTAPSVSITMNSNKTVTANFTQNPVNYNLTISVSPFETGTISLSPLPQNPIIPPPYGGAYPQGTTVAVTANPNSGYTFDHWSGDASGNNPTIVLTMNANKNITANFAQIPPISYTLTTHVDGSGAVSLVPPGGTYPSGITVAVTANPSVGWSFERWSGDVPVIIMNIYPAPTTIQIVMDSNKDITAHFKQESVNYTLTTEVAEGQGSVSPSGMTTYASGVSVEITATPAAGYRFDYWSGDISGSQNPTTITMNSNKTVSAHFRAIPQGNVVLTMVPLPSEGGTILATQLLQAQQDFPLGSTVAITAFPNKGYRFDYWSGDVAGTSATTSVVMDGNKTAIAVFVQEVSLWQTYQTEIIAAIALVMIAGGAILFYKRK